VLALAYVVKSARKKKGFSQINKPHNFSF